MVHREADVSLSVSGLFWWEHLHFEGSKKLLHSRLIHSCLNGTSTTIGVINVRRANKEQIRAFSRINKPGLPSILPRKGPCLKKLSASDRAKDQISIQLDSLSLVFTFSGHQIVALKPLFSQSDAACGMFKEQSGVCSPLSVEQTAFLISVNKRKIASSHICSNSFWHGCKFWTISTPMARILYLNVITAVIIT